MLSLFVLLYDFHFRLQQKLDLNHYGLNFTVCMKLAFVLNSQDGNYNLQEAVSAISRQLMLLYSLLLGHTTSCWRSQQISVCVEKPRVFILCKDIT